MSDLTNDPWDLLRASNPVPNASRLELPPLGDLVPEARTGNGASSGRRRLRRSIKWIAPVVLLGATGVAAAVITSRPVTNPLDIGCYEQPTIDADTIVVAADDEESAVETCAQLWRAGEIRRNQDAPPQLTACVLPTGAIGVFPGTEDVCDSISPAGSTSPPPTAATDQGTSDDPVAVIELRDDLTQSGRASSCLSPAEARHLAEAALARHELEGWLIEDGPGATGAGFDEERPCATFAIEPEHRTIVLVPFPRSR